MIFVTGGTGLIGSHLLFWLLKESNIQKIIATKRPTSNLNNVKKVFSYYTDNVEEYFSKIEWIDVDLLNYSELIQIFESKEISTVYHCVGFISYYKYEKKLLYEGNVKTTENIVKCSLKKNIKKLIYVSSIASLGESKDNVIITEDFNFSAEDESILYSRYKYLAELEVWKGINEGLNAVIINPSVVLGPGFWETKGVGMVLKMIYKGFNLYTEGVTGFVDVRDVVKIMIMLVNSDISGERYIVSEGNYTFKEILIKIIECFGKKNRVKKANLFFLKILAQSGIFLWIIFRKKTVITPQNLSLAFKRCFYSNEKIKKALNYNFIPIDETIKFIVERFKEDHKEIFR